MRVRTLPLALMLLIFLCLPVLSSAGSAAAAGQTVIRVSAGVGLKDALSAIRQAYANNEPAVEIEFNFAASGFLRKQIEEGAPVDLFLAPGRQHLQALLDGGYTDEQHSCALLGNNLALIVAKEKVDQIKDFADLKEQAESFTIGLPEMVPVGKYAQETLTHFGLWNDLEPRMIYGKSVRQVLAYVDSGNADAGLVFASDTKLLTSAAVAAIAPAESHSPIVFSMAGIRGSRQPAALENFMAFLKGDEASTIFADYGFTPLSALLDP